MKETVLSIENLQIDYKVLGGYFRAINGVSLEIKRNEVFGIVGESGSGKSTLCKGFLRLLPTDTRINAAHILFDGKDVQHMSEKNFRHVRWKQISYIPQSSMNSLNPLLTVRRHFAETIQAHEGKKKKEELNHRINEALENVSLDAKIADKYAHELSGGMKQRVCIAMATLLSPQLIVADEPTSALDVVSQRMVLQLLSDVRSKLKASMIMIGHDMALQAQIADRIGIMYAGYFAEIGTASDIFDRPLHPYTKSLIRSIPSIRKKEDFNVFASRGLSDEERERLCTPRALHEASPGHFVADFL